MHERAEYPDIVVPFRKDVAIAGDCLLLFVTGEGGISIDGPRRPLSYGWPC